MPNSTCYVEDGFYAGANHGVMDWFKANGFYTSGISENPKTVWMGYENSNYKGGNIMVCFHPDSAQEAMIFKLTFGGA